ncbi:hypothetical protein PM082_015656 [Marasmius tenuissimus]|nr:hypothetical protein PM082_015656 [Marasmius tenuissimus]
MPECANLSSNCYSPVSEAQPRRRGKKAAQNVAPQPQRSLFEDTSHPILPLLLPAFVGLNATIDDTPEDAKREVYLAGWRDLHTSWMAHCRASPHPKTVSNTVWRKLLFLGSSGSWPAGKVPSSSSDCNHHEASILLSYTLRDFPPSLPTNSSPPSNDESRFMMHELSVINFRFQLLALDCVLDETVPQASHLLSEADLEVSRLVHQRRRTELVTEYFGGSHDTFSVHDATFTLGFATEKWCDHVGTLRALAKLMGSWPGEKGGIWQQGEDPNLPQLVGPGMEWEKTLYTFFVQSYFNIFGFPLVLPRCRT